MASTDAANQAILARIAGMTSHHPAQANLFADWTLEPGDIVTVSSDGTDYSVPVFSMDFTWRGDREESEVSISATGGQKRDPPSALRRRSYGVARQQLTLEEALAAEIRRAGIKESEINTLAKAADDKVSLIIGGTAGSYTVDAAAIVTAINGQNTSGLLAAAKVQVGTGASAETLSKTITDLNNGTAAAVTGFGTATESSGEVSIPYYTNGSPSPTAAGNITFNLTTMKYYQDAIVVTGSQSWATVESSQIGSSNILRTSASSGGGDTYSASKTLTLTRDGTTVNMRDGGANGDIRAKISVPTSDFTGDDVDLNGDSSSTPKASKPSANPIRNKTNIEVYIWGKMPSDSLWHKLRGPVTLGNGARGMTNGLWSKDENGDYYKLSAGLYYC